MSIDPRPQSQPDNRLPEGDSYPYQGNTTERMLSLLREMPGADTTKIRTIEASTEAIDPALIPETPALCFIDGEHTDMAALRDAMFCAAVAPQSIIAFHDCRVVGRGISAFMRVAGGYGHPVPDNIFVVDLAGRRRVDSLQKHPRRWRAANAAGIAGESTALAVALRSTLRRLKHAVR